MLKKIQSFFEKNFISASDNNAMDEHQLNLAAAALLIEMVFQDDEINESEVDAVKQALTRQLELPEAEINELYELAEEEKHQATDYHQFTTLITQHYSQPQKIKLIESLWVVAYADNELDKHEEHMVRRISDLIHVSHKDFLQTKHKVAAKLNH